MSALPPSSSNKPWWSRNKPARDAPTLRSRASILNLTQDPKPQSSYGPPKPREHASGSKFNSFVASAMGRKHKKPTLTIQDPPPPLVASFSTRASVRSGTSPSTTTSPSHSYFANRPPVGSISTVRSYEHDIDQASDYLSEPRTPSDHPRDRRSYQNSLLTLSDPDPFAAGAVIVSRFDQDPNRLSVYSDSSLLDPNAKRGDAMPVNRMSYGSSSSNSHGNADVQASYQSYQPVSRVPSNGANAADKRHNRETSVFMDTTLPDLSRQLSPVEQLSGSAASRSRVMSAASSNGVIPRGNNSFQGTTAHPQLRQRGMTVAGEQIRLPPAGPSRAPIPPPRLHRQASDLLLRNDSPALSSTPSPIIFHSSRSSVSTTSTATPVPTLTRPLVLVRKASTPRVNVPPLYAAPPSSRLPAPPLSPFSMSDLEESMEPLEFPDVPSSNSSSLSFASMSIPSGDEILQFMDSYEDQEEDRISTYSPRDTLRELDIDIRPRISSLLSTRSPSHNSEPQASSSKSLKKAVSQQNLMGRRRSEVSVASTGSSSYEDTASSPTQSSPNSKGPRKQRSFHHARLPLPPLPPLRHTGSRNELAEQQATPPSPSLGPSTPQSIRRRLFSGSSGRRTSLSKASSSPPHTADDDVRSVLSLDARESQASYSRDSSPPTSRQRPIMMSFTNMGNQLALVTENACIAPAWDEIGSYNSPATRRTSQSEYTPQHIMSPADMLKLEEQLAHERVAREQENQEREEEETRKAQERKAKLELDPGDFGMAFASTGVRHAPTRPRNNSVMSSKSNASTATLAFGSGSGSGDRPAAEDVHLRGILLQHTTGAPARRPATASGFERQQPPRNVSLFARGDKTAAAAPRPSTAQPALSLSPPASPRMASDPSPDHPSVSLPPPPRPRLTRDQLPRMSEENAAYGKRASLAPFQPLSPPPRRRTNTVCTEDDDGHGSSFSSRPPSAFNAQKLLNRRSIMKKPSFLDFEDAFDDDEDDHGYEHPANMRMSPTDMEGSFLDLDRGKDSFDTIRSSDDNVYGF